MFKVKKLISCLFVATIATSSFANTNVIKQDEATITTEQINRISALHHSLGITNATEREILSAKDGGEVSEQLIKDIHQVLKKYKTIDDKMAFLMGMNASLKSGHIHVNQNFKLALAANEQQFVNVLYTSFLFRLYEKTKNLNEQQAQAEWDKLERETPFKFYKDDLDKVKKYFS